MDDVRLPATPESPARKPGERDARLSLLKVLGSMGVVMVHTSMYPLGQRGIDSWTWWIANLGNTMGRNMSSLFAMVAGAVLLARAIEAAPGRFVAQRLRRLLPAVLVWSAFYFWWRHANGETLTWFTMARDLAFGMPNFHLWFLFAMLGLYVLMPGVRLLVRDDGVKSSQYFTLGVLAVATCLSVVGMAALGHSQVLFVSYTPLLLVYLVGGYLLYRDRPSLTAVALWISALVCVGGIMLVVRFLEPGPGPAQAAVIQMLRGPLAMGWIFTIFLAVMHWRLPPGLARVAEHVAPITLGIYALHPFWIDIVDKWVLPFKQGSHSWIPAAVCAYVLSALSGWCLARVPRLRSLVS